MIIIIVRANHKNTPISTIYFNVCWSKIQWLNIKLKVSTLNSINKKTEIFKPKLSICLKKNEKCDSEIRMRIGISKNDKAKRSVTFYYERKKASTEELLRYIVSSIWQWMLEKRQQKCCYRKGCWGYVSNESVLPEMEKDLTIISSKRDSFKFLEHIKIA